MRKGKDLGGREPPLERRGSLPPNLPHSPRTSPKSTRLYMAKSCFALYGTGALGGSFLFRAGGDFFESAAVALVLWVGCTERYAGAPPSDCALWECVTYQTAPIKKRGIVGNDLCVVPLRGMLLVNGYTIPYTSAEIPPAGAPAGFDSAATVGFCVRHYTVVPLRSE